MTKTKAILGGLQTLALATSLVSASAFADTTSATTTASAQSVAPKLIDKISIGLLAQYVGPSITQPGAYQVNEYGIVQDGENGAGRNTQIVSGFLGIGYKIGESSKVGLQIRASYVPVMGHNMTLKTPNLTVSNSKLINRGNFNLSADLRTPLAITSAAKKAGLLTGLGSLQTMTYDIPNTKLTVGTLSIINWSLYSAEAADGTSNMMVALTPFANYQFTEKLAGTLNYDMGASHGKGTSLTDWSNDGTDLQIGLGWDAAKGVNLNPYLQLSPGGKVSLDSTSVGMYVSAKIL